jgi:hypothetical protein
MKKLFILFLFLTGCMGHIYTVKNPIIKNGVPVEGIIVYQPKPVVLVTKMTQLENEEGDIIGSEDDGNCQGVENYEVTSIPDYSIPYLIYYRPKPFSSGEFNVVLDKGVVTQISSGYTQSNDTFNLSPIINGALSGAMAVKSMKPACNAGKKMIRMQDLPK